MPRTFSPPSTSMLLSDPDMHHGTCVANVPWCMSGSLIRGGGETCACATQNFTYLLRGLWLSNAPLHKPEIVLPCYCERRRSRRTERPLVVWNRPTESWHQRHLHRKQKLLRHFRPASLDPQLQARSPVLRLSMYRLIRNCWQRWQCHDKPLPPLPPDSIEPWWWIFVSANWVNTFSSNCLSSFCADPNASSNILTQTVWWENYRFGNQIIIIVGNKGVKS